ncbi:MAG TPA: M20/M25/M40 family metallo-hydrolase, partial [Thalassobaculum sp.]
TAVAAEAAVAVAGEARVMRQRRPLMGSEDFAYMLNAVPGCYVFAGNGDGASVHHPEYDFNDELLAHGASYWSTLVERELKRV